MGDRSEDYKEYRFSFVCQNKTWNFKVISANQFIMETTFFIYICCKDEFRYEKIAGRKRPALVDPSHKEVREVQTDRRTYRSSSGSLLDHFQSTSGPLNEHRTDTGRTINFV